MEKIQAKATPDEGLGEDAIDPFNLWEGANFRLKIRTVDKQRNYNESIFDSPSSLPGSDSDLEKIWRAEYPLAPFLDKSNFKSFDDLKSRLDKVLGVSNGPSRNSRSLQEELDDDIPDYSAKQPSRTRQAPERPTRNVAPSHDSFDDDEDFFAGLSDG